MINRFYVILIKLFEIFRLYIIFRYFRKMKLAHADEPGKFVLFNNSTGQ